jgi:hypothetical protein
VYANAPGTLAEAFNCVALRTVPPATAAGALQVIVGAVFGFTVIETLSVAVV